MTAATVLAPWEPSAWMRDRLAAVEALATRARAADPDPASVVVVAALTRHPVAGTREDRTCDRCRVYVAPTSDRSAFQLLSCRLRPWLVVVGGLCATCATAEGVPHE